MEKFKAYRVHEVDKKVSARFEEMSISELDAGEVVIRVAYSCVNYKDALAVTGAGRVIRRFPCVGGIDLSGTVVESEDARFSKGDAVLATSYDLGVSHDGGFAEYARVPADWIVPMPKGMTLFEAMALGTAGYTAALGVVRMEQNGLKPANGPVVVTGATGGVGSIAIDVLSKLGFSVTALTGKESETAYLKGLGAKEVMLRSGLDLTKVKPIDKMLWAGAVDNLGGEMLSWLMSTMKQSGPIASIGNAVSANFSATVFPLILRGVSLLGIDSGYTPMPVRREVWRRLASDMKPDHLREMVQTVPFEEIGGTFERLINGQMRGRFVVDMAA
jgi:putative YhdH/YhfP family quinone oxidoreductase